MPQQDAPDVQQAPPSAQQSAAAGADLDLAVAKPVAATAARVRTARTIREFFMMYFE